MDEFKIEFLPFKTTVKAHKGETILDVARRSNISIESVCGGKGLCGKCRIRIVSDIVFLKIDEKERVHISEKELKDGVRLACLTRVNENLAVEVPKESITGNFVRDKTEINRYVDLFPMVCLYRLEIPPPSLSEDESDLERVKRALKKAYKISPSKIDHFCLRRASTILRDEDWSVNVVVWGNEEILDIRSKKTEGLYGIAIDIGTTTIGAYILSLIDGSCLASGSMLNPQIKFGEDIMTRIGFIAENGVKGLEILNKTLIKALNTLIERLSNEAGIYKDDIFEATVVGNTVMHHIFLKINPAGLGVSPFNPFFTSSVNFKARDIGLKINPAGNIYVLPLKKGFVGGDTTGVVLALKPYLTEDNNLIIDIGTNGELVVGNKDRLVCASCATGPALEGAHVKYGMRADTGAIERIFIDPVTKDVKYNVIGDVKPKGMCGSGVIDAVSQLFSAKIIDNSGRFRKDAISERLRISPKMTEFIIAYANETATGKDITITQKDIRNVQLAKAAIYAGAKLLLAHLGVERPSKVMLAGAFGNYIDIRNAYNLGMFPFSRLTDIIAVGNAAGEGAIFALLNKKERKEAENIIRKIEYVELSLCSEFQKEFLDALYIPHRKDPFPEIDDL